jgi:hypothetical protein
MSFFRSSKSLLAIAGIKDIQGAIAERNAVEEAA